MAEQAGNLDSYWNRLLDRRAAWLHVFGRLKPGASVDEAKAGLQPWFRSLLETETRTVGFPNVTADQRREFLASILDVESASGGLSGRRRALVAHPWDGDDRPVPLGPGVRYGRDDVGELGVVPVGAERAAPTGHREPQAPEADRLAVEHGVDALADAVVVGHR